MKNEHIKTLTEVVPMPLRLEVYKEALEFIEQNPCGCDERDGKVKGLCLMLPVLLWGLDDCMDYTPDGHYWDYLDTPIAFPEIGKWVKIIQNECTDFQKDQIRIQALTEIIEELENGKTK